MEEQKAWVVMATSGESWGPAAVYLDKDEAQRVAATLNHRLYGQEDQFDHGYWTYSGFSVSEVRLNPHVEDTGKKQYHIADPDDPDWHLPFDPEMADGAPDEMWGTATMLESGWMREYELREPKGEEVGR